MKKLPNTDRVIEFIAPRDLVDFLVKILVFNTFVLAAFAIYESSLLDDDLDHLVEHTIGVGLLSIPMSGLSLGAIWYLNRLRKSLVMLATTDLLTGLNNRRAFMDAAKNAKSTSGGVLMMVDLDHFKRINDTYGHTVGDDCLRAMADVLRAQVRAEDIVGRIGGEEFAIFLVDAPIETARRIGERLSRGASVDVSEIGDALNITASVGAAELPHTDCLDEILVRADHAMYSAKNSGRARLVFWEKTCSSAMESRSA